jgi:predicted kinase
MSTLNLKIPKKSLLVPIGAPGSGKSTLLNQVCQTHKDRGLRFGNDDVRRIMYGKVSTLGPSRLVAEAARAMAAVRMGEGLPVALDSTHAGATARKFALELAKSYDYTCVALLSTLSATEVKSRNNKRPKGIRVVGFIVDQMLGDLKNVNSSSLYVEGFDEIYEFDASVDELVIDFY